MSVLLAGLLSFFCIVDVGNPEAAIKNIDMGCELFSVWSNAHNKPRYWFLHCADELRDQVDADGFVVMENQT